MELSKLWIDFFRTFSMHTPYKRDYFSPRADSNINYAKLISTWITAQRNSIPCTRSTYKAHTLCGGREGKRITFTIFGNQQQKPFLAECRIYCYNVMYDGVRSFRLYYTATFPVISCIITFITHSIRVDIAMETKINKRIIWWETMHKS